MITTTTRISNHIDTLDAIRDDLQARLWTLTSNDDATTYELVELVELAIGQVTETITAVYKLAVEAGEL